MGNIEVVKGASLGSLQTSVPASMGGAWQQGHQRTQILVIIQRRHRERFEQHAASLQLNHPCWCIFYRPREEAAEVSDYGLDPNKASFMFLDVAMEDLGRWVGPLAKDDWPREEVIITPSSDAGDFPSTKWTCFRDPWISQIEVFPMLHPPFEFTAKAWITKPGGAPIAVQPPSATPNPVVQTPPTPTPEPEEPKPHQSIPAPEPEPLAAAFELPSAPISIPNFSGGTADATTSISPAPVEAPPPAQTEASAPTESESAPLEVEGAEDDEGPDLTAELIDTINLLKVGGLSPEQIMESPAFAEASERATAAGIDAWSIFVANAN